MTQRPTYWFPAKQYGWGWGPPTCWQGWGVMAAFAVVMAGNGVWLGRTHDQVTFLIVTALAVAGLIAICWAKGTPPRWRWGGD
ncbi:hypothetical protein GTZ99_03800 [Novosphingobium sp. FSY-8]|uniref:DUF2631 domain-containing protein n=1 Tax=Novosphingobium ovatum TaxID=1908523 RepID=A0ABW9XAV3_9SPHN|nr:hypothetical protein [Novosphingobium ovatum]NBC35676.1 hypothetical protein [Novosphingobium ovatum]